MKNMNILKMEIINNILKIFEIGKPRSFLSFFYASYKKGAVLNLQGCKTPILFNTFNNL